MLIEDFRYLAAVIASHPDGKVFGRTRLQKTIRLLQRLGLPTDYDYKLHFYGPYSDGLNSEISLLESFGLACEEEQQGAANPYYVIEATEDADPSLVEDFSDKIEMLANANAVTLELAATYDTFRDLGHDHETALELLWKKKGSKCDDRRAEEALELLDDLGLPTE